MGEVLLDEGDFLDDVLDAARAVAVAADGLGPEAEGALGAAAASRVDGDEGELVHVFEDRAVGGVHGLARRVAEGEAGDFGEGATFGDFLDGEVELLAGHEIDHGGGEE